MRAWILMLVTGAAVSGAAAAAASECVTIKKPGPSIGYTYEHQESSGNKTRYTDFWEEITDKGSRVRVERAAGKLIQINEHHIVNDVVVLDRTIKKSASGGVIDSTVFHPGIVSDPAFRVCTGGSWKIPSVTATYQSNQTQATASSPAGTLRIVAIHEKIAVPAGTFDTVHYVRTSQSIDEYWKSIDQGVVVKHVGGFKGGAISESLVSIK